MRLISWTIVSHSEMTTVRRLGVGTTAAPHLIQSSMDNAHSVIHTTPAGPVWGLHRDRVQGSLKVQLENGLRPTN